MTFRRVFSGNQTKRTKARTAVTPSSADIFWLCREVKRLHRVFIPSRCADISSVTVCQHSSGAASTFINRHTEDHAGYTTLLRSVTTQGNISFSFHLRLSSSHFAKNLVDGERAPQQPSFALIVHCVPKWSNLPCRLGKRLATIHTNQAECGQDDSDREWKPKLHGFSQNDGLRAWLGSALGAHA